MGLKQFLVVLALLIGFTQTISAQDKPKELIDAFFQDFEMEGPSFAIDKIYETNPWNDRIPDAINNIKTQLERFDEELVGNYYGYEPLVTKKLGNSFELHSYFLKFDRQFLRITFQFYKPKDEWRLYSFQFDDNFDEEIEEAAKLYYTDLEGK